MLYAGLDLPRADEFAVHPEPRTARWSSGKRSAGGSTTWSGNWPGSGEPLEVVLEATGGYGPLHEKLSEVARRVVMAHPAGLALIWKSKRKNDRVDAQKLAKLLYLWTQCLRPTCRRRRRRGSVGG